VVLKNGNTGIGTATPRQLLEVTDVVLSSGASAGFKFDDRYLGYAYGWQWYSYNGAAYLYDHTNNQNKIAIDVNGQFSLSSGAYCSTGGAWTNASDENIKDNITALNSKDLLDKINQLNITRWKYKSTEGEYHIGPMAQQFYSLFNVGVNNVSISSIDPAGVALAGVQATNQKYDAVIATMQQQIDELKAVIAGMKK
jgi:hypothetical protein